MPPDAIYVGRPSKWGNPFDIIDVGRVSAVLRFATEAAPLLNVAELRGKNLACWCPLCAEHANGKPLNLRCDNCAPCHADVLGELSNA